MVRPSTRDGDDFVVDNAECLVKRGSGLVIAVFIPGLQDL